LINLQISFIQQVQSLCGPLEPLFQNIAFLGTGEFFLIIIPLIMWNYNRSLGFRLLMLMSLNMAILDGFKLLFHMPRPYWISSQVKAYSYYGSFGFPSGHAQNVTVFFGLIAAWVKKNWIRIICVLIIILVGLARIFQAVHFPTDILGGYIIGIFFLCLFLILESPVKKYIISKPIPVQVLIAFVASCVLLSYLYLSFLIAGAWHIPEEWMEMALAQTGVAIHPDIPRDGILSAGLFFGGAVGLILTSKNIIPEGRGPITYHIARYLIGIIILLCFWYSLNDPASSLTPSGLFLVYFRSIIAGLWITAGAPLLFKKVKLLK